MVVVVEVHKKMRGCILKVHLNSISVTVTCCRLNKTTISKFIVDSVDCNTALIV